MKKRFLYFALVIFLLVGGCAKEEEISQVNAAGTEFYRLYQSYPAGNVSLDRSFYVTEEDLDLWKEAEIAESYVQIGYKTVGVSLEQVQISENRIYNTFYIGYMVISGEFSETEGDAYLILRFASETERRTYYLGEISILDSGENAGTEIQSLVSGGVVLQDEDGWVNTYGVVIHCTIANPITLIGLGFGLENMGLDGSRAVIYSPQEYQKEIYTAIEQSCLDEVMADAYQMQYGDSFSEETQITLEEGEYYIYLPIMKREENHMTIDQGTYVIRYLTENGEEKTLVSGCWPFFGGNYPPLDGLEDWFEK